MTYTQEDKEIIFDLYKKGKIDEIFKRFNGITKNALYSMCSKNKIKQEAYFWPKEDIIFLIENHGILSNKEISLALNGRHSPSCVATKAKSLGLENHRYWTEEETKILTDLYSTQPIEIVMKALPYRTLEGIRHQAEKLKLLSYHRTCELYTQQEKDYILNNYSDMSDQEIADNLNRPLSGIQEQRRKLGIYYVDKTYQRYECISKLFRKQLHSWKQESMKQCGYKCIFTGSKDFQIHHLVGFNIILREAFEKMKEIGLLKTDDLNSYSTQEIKQMIDVFKEVHSEYPLGVCIKTDIHIMFHKIYGNGNNTLEQWNEFIDNYKNYF